MLRHVVLFRPRPDLSVEHSKSLLSALARALAEISAIRRFTLGLRVKHGAEYERLMDEDFAFAAILEFDDLAGLHEYLGHPAHRDLGTRFMSSLAASAIYDYEEIDRRTL
jgi:hypothetical protein